MMCTGIASLRAEAAWVPLGYLTGMCLEVFRDLLGVVGGSGYAAKCTSKNHV